MINSLASRRKTCAIAENVNKLIEALAKEWSHLKTLIRAILRIQPLLMYELTSTLLANEGDMENDKHNIYSKKLIAIKAHTFDLKNSLSNGHLFRKTVNEGSRPTRRFQENRDNVEGKKKLPALKGKNQVKSRPIVHNLRKKRENLKRRRKRQRSNLERYSI